MTTLADYVTTAIDAAQADVWIHRSGPERGMPSRARIPGGLGVTITARDKLDPGYAYYMLEHLCHQGIWNGVEVTGDRFRIVTLQPTGGNPTST